jgi:hypothetical protein
MKKSFIYNLVVLILFIGCKKKVEIKEVPPPPPPPPKIEPPKYPTYNYVAANRRDIFVPLIKKREEKVIVKEEGLPEEKEERKEGDIEYFSLIGIIWDEKKGGTALFTDGYFKYILRERTLYRENYKRIGDIRGRILNYYKVILYQGKKKRLFELPQKPSLVAAKVKSIIKSPSSIKSLSSSSNSNIIDIKIKDKRVILKESEDTEELR